MLVSIEEKASFANEINAIGVIEITCFVTLTTVCMIILVLPQVRDAGDVGYLAGVTRGSISPVSTYTHQYFSMSCFLL